MKECPSCNKKTVPNKWLLFNKSENTTKYCFQCPSCNVKLRKQKFFILELLTAGALMEGTLVLLMTIVMNKLFNDFTYSFLTSVLFFSIVHFSIEYFVPLKIADESYCIGGMTRVGAFFALMFIGLIVLMTIYCLVIQPFILHQSPCS